MTKQSPVAKGSLAGNRIIVWSIDDARKLFGDSFYGKPLGIPKPKGPDFNAPLILDLMEGYYLLLKEKLTIVKAENGRKMTMKGVEEVCAEEYMDFSEKFLVYKNLRDLGYVVTPGIKFGCDFAVYEHGPGIDHAPYLVEVVKSADTITGTGVVLAGRLATTVRKQFIISVVKDGKADFLSFEWWRA